MAMTAAVKDELARVELSKSCCRKAEVSALLRFAGGLHIVAGNVVVEVEVDDVATSIFFLGAMRMEALELRAPVSSSSRRTE